MLDSDRAIALEQLPLSVRRAFRALWALDLAFADVISTTRDVQLGAIRLAWWREHLEALDQSSISPAEPRLRAVVTEMLPRGITGEQLSHLEEAWLPALEPFPWAYAQADGFRLRGKILFTCGAMMLGADPRLSEAPGEVWSLIDGADHCSDEQSRKFLLAVALSIRIPKVPRNLRALTITAALALANAKRPKSQVVRGVAAILHQTTGGFILESPSRPNSQP